MSKHAKDPKPLYRVGDRVAWDYFGKSKVGEIYDVSQGILDPSVITYQVRDDGHKDASWLLEERIVKIPAGGN